MITLENEYLTIQFKKLGAELTKIYSKETKLNYLWNGDATFWKRHAPILFPIVGKLKGNTYKINGEFYELPQHGFARDLEFSIVNKTTSKITFELTYSKETLINYPFKFTLQVSYELKKNQVLVNYKVINVDDTTIFFSIGAHPAFNCPLVKGTSFNDYYLEFEKAEKPTQLFLNPQTGFRNNISKTINLEKQIDLSYDLFKNDALMFEGIESKKVSLKSKKHNHGIHLHIPNWRYLAFWTKKTNTPFICFEPWMGIADNENTDQIYSTKEGIQELSVNKTYENEYRFEVF
ncbi:aldose 1-epimerase family protein [uncultured Tenacibaculum sp.]|uniref:aldose 1-epimerase family protein n=1 Tax=uncultured Tenacibaculum sp. TaxID=174713 RepID=UPI0026323806|nr:aldose 1-epimerase family protein [uncultured Tenacibaculum sp.]